MTSFIHQLAAKRRKFLDGLDANEGDINLDIFEGFYPDQAHFIYELLQNAEDARATTATFTLKHDGCLFEHDGKRSFTEDDVRAITGIHNSNKTTKPDQIGQFGVGFKSVFVYTLTPVVYSGEFAFKIARLVMPDCVDDAPNIGNRTRFDLPFNSPKKSAQEAYAEIEAGLNALAETTLLFLSNLKSIRWQIGESISGVVERIPYPKNHFETRKTINGEVTARSHFIRFDEPVEGLKTKRIAVAFSLDFLTKRDSFNPKKSLAEQMKLVPANPGRVAVFFPAEKESSGLRFHLHAPFVPELSRASIKETPANDPLFQQLAKLTAASLHLIRDRKLLTGDFLSVLPNPKDTIPARYRPIRAAIVAEMNSQPLTPTHSKSHAPAKHLLQAKASLKELLSPEDIQFLVANADEPRQWAIGASQKKSDVDRFLDGLDITEWDIDTFVKLLVEKASEQYRQVSYSPSWVGGPDNAFMEWLSDKSPDWHQRLYALLFIELDAGSGYKGVKGTKIVRLTNGGYGVGDKSFFASEETTKDDGLPRVDTRVFKSGKNKCQQDNARKFLEAIGVREVGEAEEVEAILKQRYAYDPKPNEKTYRSDFKRFISFIESQPHKSQLFKDYYIFECDGDRWCKPTQVFLDEPFQETGLHAYYDRLGENAKRYMLSKKYEQSAVDIKKVASFAFAVGVHTRLEILSAPCKKNPEWQSLIKNAGERARSPIDTDYVIPQLKELFEHPSLNLSKLIWETLRTLPTNPDYLQAVYQRSVSGGPRRVSSQLVHHLRNAAWIPQANEAFVRPVDASRDLLPSGFSFDPGWRWLEAIQFGQDVAKKSEEYRQRQNVARDLGFRDGETLERARRFAALSREEQEQFFANRERREVTELPNHEPSNPERRAECVFAQAAEAPERLTEERARSVSIGREKVKEEAGQYLRQQYTNADGEMICQVCKTEARLPFKRDDGSDYFEKIPFLPKLKRQDYQNYLALCPNHAAMFQHANGSSDLMQDMFLKIAGNELEIVLAQQDLTIYFTKTHIADLKAVIAADQTRTTR